MNTNISSKSISSGDSYGDNTISQSLQKLLCLRPYEVGSKKTLILTTDSRLWDVEKIGNFSTIIDLSTLIGIKNEETLSGVKFLDKVIKQFLLAGWSRRSIFIDYRRDLKNRQLIDIAIFEPEDIWQIAVEVVTARRSLSSAQQQIRSYNTTAKWLCATNGIEFILINRETDESQLLDHAPSPTELGIQEGETNHQKISQRSLQISNPSSVKVLLTEVEKSQPESIVTDFIVPWVFQRMQGSQIDATLSEFINTLPVNIREQMRGSLHILPVILAWAATIPSVKTLSAIVPAGVATNQMTQWLRNCLVERLRLCGVLELPKNLFLSTSVTGSVLYFGGEREQTYFDVLASRGDLISMDSRPWFDSLSKWMKGDKPSTGYIAKVENNANWAVKANNPEIEKTLERLARVGGLVPLGELCDIKPGVLLDKEVSKGNTPLINLKDFRGNYVDFENATKIEASSIPEQVLLKNGDLLLSAIGANFSVVLNRNNQPAVPGKNVIVLRLKNDTVSSEYLLEYLNSSTAKKLIAARIVTSHGILQHISIQSLREFPVPVVDSKLSQGLNDIQHIEVELRAKADELESFRRALFDAQDCRSFQGSLIELKRRGTLLQTSLQYVDRLEFQIANFYPFPIAYGFRLLESNVHPTELYREQLRVAENLLAFLGSISLALLQEQDRQKTKFDFQKYWQGGISPGHWKEIIGFSGKVFATYKDDPLAEHIHRLNIFTDKKGFGKDVAALCKAKNDFKHDRGPTVEKEIFQATQDTQERLRRCMEALAFFTEYRIRQVLDVNPSRRGSEITLICLPFIGDHPGFTQEKIISHKALPKNDLFLDAGRQEWVSLYPFITATACSSCKTRETHFIDKWDKDTAYLKSFERGHPETCCEIAEELAGWDSNG